MLTWLDFTIPKCQDSEWSVRFVACDGIHPVTPEVVFEQTGQGRLRAQVLVVQNGPFIIMHEFSIVTVRETQHWSSKDQHRGYTEPIMVLDSFLLKYWNQTEKTDKRYKINNYEKTNRTVG